MREPMRDAFLQKVISQAKHLKLYKELYANLQDTTDFSKVPFLEARHLAAVDASYFEHTPENLCVYFTSGTTQQPKAVYHSIKEIEYASDYLKWFCEMERIAGGERVAVLMDQNFWGVGYFTLQGHVKAGNAVIPIDTDLPKNVIRDLIRISRPTVISSLPSILLTMKDILKNPHTKVLETTGEILTRKTRTILEQSFQAEVFDAYGLTEGIVGVECSSHNGYHFLPDKVYLEVVNLKTGKTLPDGMWGELIMTILSNPITPIIRYRTGDICKISQVQCVCGDKSPRVYIQGRREKVISLYEGSELILKALKTMIANICGTSEKSNLCVKNEGDIIIIEIRVSKQYLKKANAIIRRVKGYNYETLQLAKRDRLRVIVTARSAV